MKGATLNMHMRKISTSTSPIPPLKQGKKISKKWFQITRRTCGFFTQVNKHQLRSSCWQSGIFKFSFYVQMRYSRGVGSVSCASSASPASLNPDLQELPRGLREHYHLHDLFKLSASSNYRLPHSRPQTRDSNQWNAVSVQHKQQCTFKIWTLALTMKSSDLTHSKNKTNNLKNFWQFLNHKNKFSQSATVLLQSIRN